MAYSHVHDTWASNMRSEITDLAHKFLLIFILFALAIFSNLIFSMFLASQNFSSCSGLILNFSCTLPNYTNFGPRFYAIVSSLSIGTIIFFKFTLEQKSFYPFIQLMISILFLLSLFDWFFSLPVKNMNQLYSSSYNIIDFIMLLNFLILITLGLFNKSLILISVILSFFVKFFSFLALYVMLSFTDGALGLFLIFLTFSFGALTPHLMALCMAFRPHSVETNTI